MKHSVVNMDLTIKRHLTRHSSVQGFGLAEMESVPSYKLGFHKIMILNCKLPATIVFPTIKSMYSLTGFTPVGYGMENDHFCFYVKGLVLVSKFIARSFFISIHGRTYEYEIKMYDRTCMELLGTITFDTFMVNFFEKRINGDELNLSNVCKDTEIIEKKIYLPDMKCISPEYLPRNITSLNLSNNHLTHLPLSVIMHYRAQLTSLNLSNNQIPSLTKLYDIKRLKITKLSLENNPLCEEFDDEITYVKDLLNLFPDLTDLDNIRVNKNGLLVPFRRNYLIYPPAKTVAEKFISLYFSHYDENKEVLKNFYHISACFSITTNEYNVTARDALNLLPYIKLSREIIGVHSANRHKNIQNGLRRIMDTLCSLPPTQHDPSTFTVDVVLQQGNHTVLVIEGVFRQSPSFKPQRQTPYYNFRRTFVLRQMDSLGLCLIVNDMLYVCCASDSDKKRSFQFPIRRPGDLMLIEPSQEDRNKLIEALLNLTNLPKNVAEVRLKRESWNLKDALQSFLYDLETNKIDISTQNHQLSELSSDSDA